MPENLIIGYTLVDEDTTITTDDEETTLPATNLLTPSPTEVWQTTDASDHYITIDFGSAQTITAMGMLYSNDPGGTQIQVEAATTEGGLATAAYDSGVVDHYTPNDATISNWPRSHSFIWNSSGETYRWWRITLSSITTSYNAGRVLLANPHQPTINFEYGDIEWGWIEDPVVTSTASGARYARERGRYRYVEFTLSYATKAELLNEAWVIDNLCGMSKPVFVVEDPSDTTHRHEHYIEGFIESMGPIEYTTLNRWQKSWRVVENL